MAAQTHQFLSAARLCIIFLSLPLALAACRSEAPPIILTTPAPTATPVPSPTPVPDWRVYIAGAVNQPGVYPAQPGHRLDDVLRAGGGPSADADLERVNLALRVADEGYYFVPRRGETPPPLAASSGANAAGAPTSGGAASGGLVNLNTATLAELDSLPNIGPARAQAIIDYRLQNGGFKSVEELLQVSGIGATIYERLRHLVTVEGG